jgi:hypothetical protein
VSLDHSSRDQGDSGVAPALEPLDGEQDTGLESMSSLAEEAVPMRDQAARELDDMREERIRAVVGSSSRRLPRPPANARVLGAGGVAVALLALVAALSSSGGSAASGGAAAQPQRPAVAKLSGQDRQARRPQRLVRAHPRRRAAIPAKRRAARRHAQREPAHRPANAEDVPSQGEAPATESQAPVSAPAPATATTESAPAPSSSPPPSTSTNPAGEEFGFER